MKTALTALGLLLLQSGFPAGREVDATPQGFHYQRDIRLPEKAQGQACAVLDGPVYEHAAGRLGGVRVYAMTRPDAPVEVPFALTESGEAGQEMEVAHAINLGRKGSAIAFDLQMPGRPYTAVELGLSGHDFYATATVSGSDGHGGHPTLLGTYALFDLTSRGLSRSTTLPLQETSFAQLHVELTVTPAPGGDAGSLGPDMVSDAKVPPSREAQTLYTTVAVTSAKANDAQTPHVDHFLLNVAAHVPVERVSFTLQPGYTKNFLRNVSLREKAARREDADLGAMSLGQMMRVHLPGVGGGAPIREETLSLAATTAANLRGAATFDVEVDNGDDAPLPIAGVRLEMRERKVCFDAEPQTRYELRYGAEDEVRAPVYDYARLFHAEASAVPAALGPESTNPAFHVEVRQLSTLERHPEILWVALIAVVAVLGTVALHSAKGQRRGAEGPKS